MSDAVRLTCACPACGTATEVALTPQTTALACGACGQGLPLPEAAEMLAARPVAPCPVCGSPDLYGQRDFNRLLGIALAAIGLLLGPFTHWISAGVAVALDALLYVCVSSVSICYACNAQLRGVSREARPDAFDIAVHDAYKFDRRKPPRPEAAVAGPLARRLRRKRGRR